MIAATPRFVSAAPLMFSIGGAEVGVASGTGNGGWKRAGQVLLRARVVEQPSLS